MSVHKEFDEDNDNEDAFNELTIFRLDIEINSHRFTYAKNFKQDTVERNITLDKLSHDYKKLTGNDLRPPYKAVFIIVDSDGGEVKSKPYQVD